MALDDAVVDAELKRLRTRVYVKRFYDKQKTTLATLHDQLAALDSTYSALVATCAGATTNGDDATRLPPRSHPNAQRLRQYTELAKLKQQLYVERDALRVLERERMLREARLQQVMDMYYRSPPPARERIPTSFAGSFRWLTIDECQCATAACRVEAQRIVARPPQRTSGLQVLGWSDQRDVTGDALAFAFEKTFPNVTPRELADRTWAMLADPTRHHGIFSRSMNARVYVLQHVDKNAVLCYWHLRPDGTPLTIKCVFLLVRFTLSDGTVVIACRYVDKDAIAFKDTPLEVEDEEDDEDPRAVYWAKMDTWTVIRRVGQRDASYLFRGATLARVWAVEVLLICMRFDSFALGSRLLPPSPG